MALPLQEGITRMLPECLREPSSSCGPMLFPHWEAATGSVELTAISLHGSLALICACHCQRKTGSAMRVSLSWSRFFALFPRLPGVALPALSVLCLSFLLLSALLPVSLSQRVPIRKACVHAHQNCTQQHSVLAQHAFLTWHLDEIRCQL